MTACKDCKFFRPKYHLVGECERQFLPGSRVWAAESKPIFVFIAHSCSEFAAQASVEAETL